MASVNEVWAPEYKHIIKVFGPRLRELMETMTITELSFRTGVSAGTLSNWLQGRTAPDVLGLFAVALVLEESLDWFFGLDEDGALCRRNVFKQSVGVVQLSPVAQLL